MTDSKANPLDEVVSAPGATSLDRVMATAPSLVTDADLDAVIGRMREQRTQFIQLEQKKQAKKEGHDDESGPGMAADPGEEPGGEE